MSNEMSPKMGNYLAEIYRLEDYNSPDANGYVSTSSLADLLNVSAPAVNRMVNRLRELGMLEHEPYQGIRLTKKGKSEALKKIRAQRIAETFLVKVMGLNWDEVYYEAHRISEVSSEPLLSRMDEMANHPTTCPHGEPIPDENGEIEILGDIALSDIDTPTTVMITRLRTREPDRLQYMEALGLVPGTELDVLHKAPFDGPMQLKLQNEYRIIGHNLAEAIRIKPVKG